MKLLLPCRDAAALRPVWYQSDRSYSAVPTLQIYEGAKQAYASLAKQMEKYNRCALERLCKVCKYSMHAIRRFLKIGIRL